MLIGSSQKFRHLNKNKMDLFLNGTKLDTVNGEKTLGVILDKHLSWDLQVDYLIKKLNSRVCLLKRAKNHLTVHCRKLLYNALIQPVLEYCCTVQGNCARIILDASVSDNSVKLFSKLGWLPIDDIIRTKKLYMLHKISLGHCPDYFASYIKYLKDTHNYNTRASKRNTVLLPSYKRTAGCKTFQVSSIRLWNNIDLDVRNILSHKRFWDTVKRGLLQRNSDLEHFKVSKTY